MQEFSDTLPEAIDSSLFGFSQQGFEFGKHLLDRVEIRRVGWQEQEMGPSIPDHAPYGITFVACEIVHDDDITRFEGGNENLLNISLEGCPVDGTIKDKGSRQLVAAKGGKEGRCFPVAMRQLGVERLASWAPAMGARHVGFCPSLVDEDKTAWFNPGLVFLPPSASSGDVRPVLLGGVNGFF